MIKSQNEIVSLFFTQYLDVEMIAGVNDGYEKVLNRLIPQIQNLLDTNMQTLLSALYRIDVDEIKFRKALELSPPEDVTKNISKLILDRIILKAETRIKYQ